MIVCVCVCQLHAFGFLLFATDCCIMAKHRFGVSKRIAMMSRLRRLATFFNRHTHLSSFRNKFFECTNEFRFFYLLLCANNIWFRSNTRATLQKCSSELLQTLATIEFWCKLKSLFSWQTKFSVLQAKDLINMRSINLSREGRYLSARVCLFQVTLKMLYIWICVRVCSNVVSTCEHILIKLRCSPWRVKSIFLEYFYSFEIFYALNIFSSFLQIPCEYY